MELKNWLLSIAPMCAGVLIVIFGSLSNKEGLPIIGYNKLAIGYLILIGSALATLWLLGGGKH